MLATAGGGGAVRGVRVMATLGVVMATLSGCALAADQPSPDPSAMTAPEVTTPPAPTATPILPPGGPTTSPFPPLEAGSLEAVTQATVFFGHRSVGADIIEMGVPAVFAEHGVEVPESSASSSGRGWFDDVWLAQDPDPLTGVRDFDARVRTGLDADIAFMKVGYIDIGEQTDVPAAFDGYRTILAALEADFPRTTFLHVTVSPTRWNPWNNAAIERYNSLVRAEYGDTGRLFDLAAALSTCTDGTTDAHETDDGLPYVMLCEEYSRDGGHLNELGASVAATEMLRVLAAAVEDG